MKLSDMALICIDEEFKRKQEQYPDLDIIKDGIMDRQQYENASPRILWILKQDYYDSGCLEKDYASRIKECIANNHDGGPSWRKMSYVSHMLLHKVCWDDIPENSLSSLLKTAVIEVDKSPSVTTISPDQTILNGFTKFKSLIFKQIDAYLPEIAIFCGGNGLFPIFSELSMRYTGYPYDSTQSTHIEKGDTVFFRAKNCTFIWAYHPAYMGIGDKEYCEGIKEAYQTSLK